MRELASRFGVLPRVFHGVLHVALLYFYIPALTKQNELSVAPQGRVSKLAVIWNPATLPQSILMLLQKRVGFLTTATSEHTAAIRSSLAL